MKKLLLVFLIFCSLSLNAQNFWERADESAILITRDIERNVTPEKYFVTYLDLDGLTKYLQKAPLQFNKKNKSLPLYIPMPDGDYMLFDVVKSPVMEPGLAKKYPGISSFKGYSRENPDVNIRFSISHYNGFYGSIYWKHNNIYIDPLGYGIKEYYMSYFTRDYKVDISNVNLTCGFDENEVLENYEITSPEYRGNELELRETGECDSVKQYNYRLALACTGEWGKTHGGTKEAALAVMVSSVNRINEVYENEFAIHLNLVENNDRLIFLDPDTDPFETPNKGGELLGEINDVILNRIGSNNYDIGHVFTNSCIDVGGIARLGVVCGASKARGVTCWYRNDLNYVITNITCHEMGHQFSATHTFNNCDGNESLSTGFEPGGGTTIMAYCGLCEDNNVDYQCLETFHSISVEQIKRYSREFGGSLCPEKISVGNSAPTVTLNYKNGFYIPILTPFYLEGEGDDCEGDDLLYSWEEMDSGPSVPIGHPEDNSPLFTAKEPTTQPIRYFPKLYNVLYNITGNYNAEIYPSYSRELNFRLIARDNHPNGGGTGWADVSFRTDEEAGPFKVLFPNSTMQFYEGDSVRVKWDVANTDNSKVNCQKVNIMLSVDRGFTYPYILKYHTDNDGEELIYLPDTITTKARIKVEAADNIFYDVANYNVKISEPEDSTFRVFTDNISGDICLPEYIETPIRTKSYNGYIDSIRFELTGLPENATYEITPAEVIAGENALLKINFDDVLKWGYYEPRLLAISNHGDTMIKQISWELYVNRYKDIKIKTPASGSSGVALNTHFEWENPKNVDYVNIYISKNPAFPPDETISQKQIRDSFFILENILDISSLYYWRLEYINHCGIIQPDTIYTFSTVVLDCKDYVSDDVPVTIRTKKTVSSLLEIEDDITITDLNVIVKGYHEYFKEIKASLVGPDSTNVLLFNYKPFNYNGNFSLVFDDQATSKMKTPPNGTFTPAQKLSVFNGKNAKGEWKLNVYDNKTGQGGKIQYFALNICSNVVLSKPVLINNELFKIPLDAAWPIKPEVLKAKDDNNTDDQLIFTIVKAPQQCVIYKNNQVLFIGDTFTQADINTGQIKLKYSGTELIKDKFYFTVFDGEGGWIDVTAFNFETDSSINAVQELFYEYVSVYPNPANNSININIDKPGTYRTEIYDLEGKKLLSKNIAGISNNTMDISGLNQGLYLIKIYNEKYIYTGKIVKQE